MSLTDADAFSEVLENNRKFEEIVVEYPPEDLCTYPEYRGKPYFSIKYKEKDDCFIGYGTYNPKVFSRYISDYFIKNNSKPKGYWMNHIEYCKKNNLIPSGLASYYWCSECECGIESKHFHRTEYNYCPKCGAQMN